MNERAHWKNRGIDRRTTLRQFLMGEHELGSCVSKYGQWQLPARKVIHRVGIKYSKTHQQLSNCSLLKDDSAPRNWFVVFVMIVMIMTTTRITP
jgi:hypothetical protein